MNIVVQNVLVMVIVAAALGYLIIRAKNKLKAKNKKGCGGCDKCGCG
jgi:large-conductance mechanosensitive channel